MRAEQTRTPRIAAIFLLSASGLLLQLSLTRVLSLIVWHHFAYLIISLALLGIGAAGSYLTLSPKLREAGDLNPWIARWAWCFSLATVACLLLITKIPVAPIAIYQHGDWSQFFGLALIEIAIAFPYFFAGVAMGAILSTAAGRIGGVYFSDLAGAAAGSLLALGLISGLGAIAAIFAAAALSSGAALLLGGRSWGGVSRAYAATIAAALALMGLSHFHDVIPIRFPPSKLAFGQESLIETTQWNPIARVDVMRAVAGYSAFAAGLSSRHPREPYRFRTVLQDGAAPTFIVRPTRAVREMSILGYYLQALPYAGYERPRVLVVGVGGGVDLLLALHHGAQRVVGVEVNSATVDLLRGEYAAFSGNLASRPDVEIRVAEGRHFLTADPRTFDVIQLSGVDTFAAASSGAYALTENYLYTAEAIRDFLEHLRPGGVLSIARWNFDPPRETLRLISTQLRALEERGIEDSSARFLIVRGPVLKVPAGRAFPWADALLKKEPFTPQEVERYRRWAEERGFEMVYDPFEPRDNLFDRLIRADPLLRGDILRDYLYDVSPSTDDNPFFFQFYRWRNLFHLDFLKPELATGANSGPRLPRTMRLGEIPVALMILLSSILFILALSGLFIVAPLRRGAGPLAGAPWKMGAVGYFALVGLGFMFVEIVLLQKLTVFLGGPTYSMAVTLSSLLFFTGVGAAFSRRIAGRLSRGLARVIGALAFVLVGEYALLEWGIPALLGLSHVARCGVAVLAIAPMGLCLGMPFPVGLRMLDRIERRLVPWAYGINGCASVLGGMLCIVVSMGAGLSVAWFGAVGLYLGAAGVVFTAPDRTRGAVA